MALAESGGEADAAEAFMRRIVGDDRWEALPARTKAQRRAEGPALVAELRSLRPPNPAPYDIAALPGARGGRPRRACRARTTRRRRGCSPPRRPAGELVVIEGASHGAHLSHPTEFADLVRRAAALA